MRSSLKLGRRNVETAHANFPQRSGARARSLSGRSDPERLNERTTDPSQSTAAQREHAPFLAGLSGWDPLRVQNTAHGGWAQFVGAYGWAR